MNTKKTQNQYRKDVQFVDFQNHVLTFLYELGIMKAMAYDREEYYAVGCIEQMAHFVKVHAVCLHNDVQAEDDEYGTLAYVGFARSYAQAKDQFLAWLDETYSIRPIYYDGCLNSYTVSLKKLCKVISGIMNVSDEPMHEDLEDEDLPF